MSVNFFTNKKGKVNASNAKSSEVLDGNDNASGDSDLLKRIRPYMRIGSMKNRPGNSSIFILEVVIC